MTLGDGWGIAVAVRPRCRNSGIKNIRYLVHNKVQLGNMDMTRS